MSIALGVVKQTRFKRQSAKGTIATSSAGQILRREQSTFELVKETYTTESEINSAQQLTSNRHGVKTINGKITGIFSPGTYSDLLGALLRRDFTAVSAITGASITIAASGSDYTLTRAAGSYLTDGIKVGQVVRLTSGSFNANNLNKNLLVKSVTALVLTVTVLNGLTLTAEGPIASATVTVPGKLTYVPITGHTNIYYTFEEWSSDVPASERNQDVKIASAAISLPGSGNAKIDLTCTGLDQSASTSALFTSPTAETTTGALVAASGLLLVGGSSIATVTDLSFTVDGKEQPADGVVGSTIRPDIFRGKVMVTGQFTAYFDSTTIADLFRNETSSTIVSALTAGSAAAADFLTFTLSQIDINSATPTDGETGLKRTYQFVAEYNSAGGAGTQTDQTTITIHDSQAT